MERQPEDLVLIEDAIWLLTMPTGTAVYDFAFDRLLACRRPLDEHRRASELPSWYAILEGLTPGASGFLSRPQPP
jgi:hypothetical protein